VDPINDDPDLSWYSKHFIFFLSSDKLEYIAWQAEKNFKEKHSTLLGPFVSYEENKVLWIQPQ
jgi:hypothetical protein